MRFGLGPKPDSAARLAATNWAAHDACLQEISSPAALLIPETDVVTYCTDTRGDVTLDYANCCRFGADFKPPSTTGFMPQPNQIVQAERAVRYAKALEPDVGFAERLVYFWSNHFSVFHGKSNMVQATVGHMERAVIRPRVMGRFADLLKAVCTHPAMICYLENQDSVGPKSSFGIQTKRSYNENLAREILELHTVGAYGGYTQADVTSFAKVLTGWTHYPARLPKTTTLHPQAGQFYFEPTRHEPGPQTVMGVTFAQSGMDQGLAVLDALAAHPSTAQHIAFKLIHHFITDEPTPAAVDSLAAVFRNSGGNLSAVYRALLLMAQSWTEPFRRLAQPIPWQASILRGLSASKELVTLRTVKNGVPSPSTEVDITYWISSLNQFPWGRLTPDGYPDDNYYWMNPNAVRILKDIAFPLVKLCLLNGQPAAPPPALAATLLPGYRSEALAAAMSGLKPDNYALLVLFTSPEYLLR